MPLSDRFKSKRTVKHMPSSAIWMWFDLNALWVNLTFPWDGKVALPSLGTVKERCTNPATIGWPLGTWDLSIGRIDGKIQ